MRFESAQSLSFKRGRTMSPEAEIALEDVTRLRDEVQRGRERLFHSSLSITLHAKDEASLKEMTQRAKAHFAATLGKLDNLAFRQREGLLSTLPLALNAVAEWRTLDTSSIARLFPFSPPDLDTRSGTLYGIDMRACSPVVYDPWDGTHLNANTAVLARSGSGKSFATKLGVLRGLTRGITAYVIDPEGEYADMARAAGGRVLSPLRLDEGEQAWSMTLRADGPEYVPLRVFRDDDLLDPGSDPLIALLGALTALRPGERTVARLMLRSLGPDWSQPHLEKAHKRPGMEPREPAYTYQTKPLQMDGMTMAVLGIGALAALKGYLWVQDGEIWKAALLGTGAALGLAAGGWAWHRWKKARKRVEDPLLIREKVSRIAFDAEIQVTAVLPPDTGHDRAEELLGPVIAAYRHFDNPAGARFKVGKVRPVMPDPDVLHPAGPGLFGRRSVLGVREVAALWHPPGAGDETPLVERSGARGLSPWARGVSGGALVGDTTAGKTMPIRFPEDLLRRHHLYVARTRMGKSTLMHHIVAHKMMEKAAGRDNDAIVVIDPHTDLVAGLLEHVPESLIDRVRLIDLSDHSRAPGINLLDTRIFSDRDRTADSVVRVAKGLWEQWGPRMQSILEQTVKTLHEANEHPTTDADEQHTILDGLRLLSNDPYRNSVLAKVNDPFLLEWWVRDFGSWHRQYRAEALAPVQTRLSYYSSSKRARAILGQRRSTIDLRETILEGGVLLVSTSQGTVGRDVAALVGASLLNLVDAVIREQGSVSLGQRRGALVVVDEMQSMPGVDYESMLSELGKLVPPSSSPPRAWQSSKTSPAPCGTPSSPTWAVSPSSRWRATTRGRWCGSWARTG